MKLHYYSFTYGKLSKNEIAHASAYSGYPNKSITLAMIEENKFYAGVDQSAVLLSCSYLGYMTKKEFNGE